MCREEIISKTKSTWSLTMPLPVRKDTWFLTVSFSEQKVFRVLVSLDVKQ